MKNVRTIIVKFVGPSNTKPGQIVITDLLHKKTKVISPGQYEGKDIADQASEYLKQRGIEVETHSEGTGYMMVHTNNFRTQIKD